MLISRTVDPTTEPVTLTEAKAHLNVTASDDDVLIAALIQAAREQCEHFTRRSFITQTWVAKLDEFPAIDEIELPVPPLQSITSVKYLDIDGVEQTLSSSSYTVDTVGNRAYLNYNEDWPSARTIQNAITITFVAGYGLAASVPQSIKQAILLLVGEMYENREMSTFAAVNNLPITAERLLWPLRHMRF